MSGAEPFEQGSLRLAGFNTRTLQSSIGLGLGDIKLVLFHGWSDSADTFKPLLRELALTGIGGIALDLPGCGRADDLQPGAQLPQFVAFIRAAIEYFDGRVVTVGQSLGGRVLLNALAQGTRAKVPACIAIAPAPLDLPPWQRMLVRNAALANGVSGINRAKPLDRMIADLVQSFRRTCFVAPEAISEQVYLDYASHYDEHRARRHIAALRQIGEELAAPIDLVNVTCAVDLIWGTHDRLAPISGAQAYLQKLPQSQLTVLQNCGHHAHLERASDIAGILRRRLATL